MSRLKYFFLISFTLLLGIILVVIGLFSSRLKVSGVAQQLSCETEITPSQDSPYCVSLVTTNFLFNSKKDFLISNGQNPRGVFLSHPDSDGLENFGDTVSWDEAGVTITTHLGVKLFVPKSLYQSKW